MADRDFDTADRIIDHLLQRAGFDAWWDDIDNETRFEILEDLGDIIREERASSNER